MGHLRKILLLCSIPLLIGSSCPTIEPPFPPTLDKPIIDNIDLKAVYSINDSSAKEYVRLHWQPPSIDSISILSYNIIRKYRNETAFSLIGRISFQTNEFYDPVENIGFPIDSPFISVYYRIVAIDSLGRRSDTSDICTLFIAPQPRYLTYDNRCINWSLVRYVGAVESYIQVWDYNDSSVWTSDTNESFITESDAITIKKCIPPLINLLSGRYYYGVFILVNRAEKSLKLGSFNVP